jgi:hypothetical protein
VTHAPDARGEASQRSRSGPVIILTYAHAGAEQLSGSLAQSAPLACTTSTGILPLCDMAAAVWRKIENRGTAPSALAVKSIRALATTMMATIQSADGSHRWCETALTAPAAAGTFLQIFPETTFLCFHRSLEGVLGEAMATYPAGLGGSPFWRYSGGHPGNNVATIAAYWAACTEALLDFEDQHPRSCLRVRREDLATGHHHQLRRVLTYLGLDDHGQPPLTLTTIIPDLTEATLAMLTRHIPAQLLAKVNELHARLALPELTP